MTRTLVFNGTDRGEPMPFGAEALADHGFDLATPQRVPVPAKLASVVRDRSGVRLEQPGPLAGRQADLLLGYFEPNLHYPALMSRLPLSPWRGTPLVSLVCWAAEDLTSGTPEQRRRTLRILRASAVVAHLSENQAAVFAAHGIPEDRLVTLRFGVDLDRFAVEEQPTRDIDLLSVGQDAGRDPGTLAEAVAGTGIRLSVVAPPDGVGPLRDVPEATLLGRVGFEDYLGLLRRARAVVVPTRELAYPTGQTVALEAAASGCAVVVTGTAAMSGYLEDGVSALKPPPGDARALRAAITAVVEDAALRDRLGAAGRATVLRRHGTAQMWAGLAAALNERGTGGRWT